MTVEGEMTARAVYPVPVKTKVGVRVDPAVTMKAGVVPNWIAEELQSNAMTPEEPTTVAVASAFSVLH